MAKFYDEITDQLGAFIEAQRIFFVGTSPADGRVNVSPKGMDTLRVLGPKRLVWLSVTGSGNETAAHVLENGRMTIMMCAFEGNAMILRLYGNARAVYPGDPDWDELAGLFAALPGSRQIFDMHVTAAQTSCGTAVPCFDHVEDRDQLNHWADNRGEDGIRDYWATKNTKSIDGKPTGQALPS